MSARERGRWVELLAIQDAALDLTIEKGYDGFTMDELAQVVGMSRRTLFQRVGDKMSAVLGVVEENQSILPATNTPPTGSPFDQYLAKILQVIDFIDVDESTIAIHMKMREAIAQEPRLATELARRTKRNLQVIEEELRIANNWSSHDPRLQLLTGVVEMLLSQAIERVLHSPSQTQKLELNEELSALAKILKDLL